MRDEIPAEIVRRDERFVAFRDIAPHDFGGDLTADEAAEQAVVAQRCSSQAGADAIAIAATAAVSARRIVGPSRQTASPAARALDLEEPGYRVTTNHGPDAHQRVHHLHWHVMGGGTLSLSM